MCSSGIEPSSVILSKTKKFKNGYQKGQSKLKPKGMVYHFKHENIEALKTLKINQTLP